ncbi:MAG: outer membrane beta-barrel protein [Prevotellaceae bacterium]|nr:outer membrane beta-barrel protein [Prevotellaceae bacterium]
MKKTLMLLAFICTALLTQAQNFSISGKITDKTTNEPIPMVGVRLMKADSTYVTGMATSELGIFIMKIEKGGNYIVKISSMGYKTEFRNISLDSKNKGAALGTIALEPSDFALKGATITAKAAKVEIKNDTFMYNASAYRVPEGAYLESLIDQLPGAEIDDNGAITINGKTVSQIRVDGKDFFKGDNSVAMKNLPADFVKKIKAYDKKSDYTEQTGIDDGNEETVLDLELKQKLKRAWSGNADLAIGNKDRYSGQLFGLGLADNSRIAFFGSSNNVGSRGFGRRGGGGNGLTANKGIGTDLFWNNGKKSLESGFFEIGGRVGFNYSGNDVERTSNSESFYAAGKSNFSNSSSKSLSSRKGFNASLNLKWNPDSMTTMQFRPSFSYNKSSSSSTSLSATFNEDPYQFSESPLDSIFKDLNNPENANSQLKDITVNRNNRTSFSNSSSTSANGELNITRRLNTKGRSLSLRLYGSYSDSDSKSFSLSDIHYYQTNQHTVNNQYSTSPSKNWNYSVRASYSEPIIKDFFFQGSYTYEHKYQDQDRNLFQLDSLDGYGHNGITPSHPLGHLPSTDSLLIAKNIENSRYATYYDDIQYINLGFRYVNSDFNINLGVNMQPQHTKLDYQKNALDTVVTRNIFKTSPYVNFKYNISKVSKVEFKYSGYSTEPSMTNLLDITDTSDPLNITKGNPGLKPSWTNELRAEYNNYFRASQTSINFNLRYNDTRNSISNAVSYDEETGVSTSRPENINGNWNFRASGGFNSSFSDESPFSISGRTNYNYSQSVGFVSLNKTDSQKNTSRSNTISQRLRGSFRTGLFEFSLNGNISYQHSRNKLQPQADLDTYNFSYSGNIQYTTDFGLGISTNIGMESRRGYADASMNTNELIWNAQLSQSFLKGKKAVVSLQFYDILHKRSNVSRSISAYSRTDSRTNSINSYFMLHFIYKLNVFNGSNGRMGSNNNSERKGSGQMPQGGNPGRGGGGMGGPGRMPM